MHIKHYSMRHCMHQSETHNIESTEIVYITEYHKRNKIFEYSGYTENMSQYLRLSLHRQAALCTVLSPSVCFSVCLSVCPCRTVL